MFLLRYGLAALSVGFAVLLMLGLQQLGLVADAGPALLVAVAISALYGGVGPGVLALALATLVGRDPVVLVAGTILVAACVGFRRPVTKRQPFHEAESPKETSSTRTAAGHGFDNSPAKVSGEANRATPPPLKE
jgi:hypothetical protein